MPSIDIGLLVLAAAGVVGIMEYLKGFWQSAPGWIWHLALPFAATGVALALDGGPCQIAIDAIMLLAFCEIGYAGILKNLKALAERPKG